jgi:hypothetical protein
MTGVMTGQALLDNKRRIIQQSGIMELVIEVGGCNQLRDGESNTGWSGVKRFRPDGISSGVGLPREC